MDVLSRYIVHTEYIHRVWDWEVVVYVSPKWKINIQTFSFLEKLDMYLGWKRGSRQHVIRWLLGHHKRFRNLASVGYEFHYVLYVLYVRLRQQQVEKEKLVKYMKQSACYPLVGLSLYILLSFTRCTNFIIHNLTTDFVLKSFTNLFLVLCSFLNIKKRYEKIILVYSFNFVSRHKRSILPIHACVVLTSSRS